MFEHWDTGLYSQHYLLNMSNNGFEDRVDEVEGLVAKLQANDRTVKRLCFEFEKWEDLNPWRNADDRAEIDEDVEKLCTALEGNRVVRRVEVGSGLAMHVAFERGAKAIARVLRRNQTVEDITIYGWSFSGVAGIPTVLEGLVGNHVIKKLTISGQDGCDAPPPEIIGKSISRALAKVLPKTSIEELVLVDEAIDWEEGLDLICAGLRKNRTIKTLDLVNGLHASDFSCHNQNCLHPGICARLCEAIGGKAKVRVKTRACPGLNSLITNHQNIGELRVVFGQKLDAVQWRDFAKAFARNNSIETVIFCNDRHKRSPETIDWRWRSVFEAIATKSVVNLMLSGMPLDDYGVGIICKALCRSTSIRELKLYSCGKEWIPPSRFRFSWEDSPEDTGDPRITATSANAIAKLLRSSLSLESVHFSSLFGTDEYAIGDEGAMTIAKAVALRGVKTTQLVLESCNITDKGGAALCRLLNMPYLQLEVLDLKRNNFGFPAVKRFVDCLSDNSTLRTLNISSDEKISNSEKVDLQTRIFNVLKRNHVLSELTLPWINTNKMSQQQKLNVCAAFQDMLKVNHTIHSRSFPDFYKGLDEVMRSANYKHPVLSSAMKNASFPSHLIDDVPVSLIPGAIERADDIAGVDGVFSLLRRVGDGIWGGIVSPASAKKNRKRCKESVEEGISELKMAVYHVNSDGSVLL